MSEFQYRAVHKDGYVAEWHNYDGDMVFSVEKRGLINDSMESVEIRHAPDDGCIVCEALVFAGGLCEYHYEEAEQDLAEDEGLWPDFHDEPLGLWDEPNLPGLRDVY